MLLPRPPSQRSSARPSSWVPLSSLTRQRQRSTVPSGACRLGAGCVCVLLLRWCFVSVLAFVAWSCRFVGSFLHVGPWLIPWLQPFSHRTAAAGDIETAYTSEANRAAKGTVAASFIPTVTRRFPGVPKSVEEFKIKIVERNGVTGVRRLSRLLKIMDNSGEGLLSRKEFKFGLAVRATRMGRHSRCCHPCM